MSAAATAPTPTEPTRTARLLNLVRALIDYGRNLATTLQQRTAATCLADITRGFGILDFAHVLARITLGLHRAAALEARLTSHPVREPSAPAALRAPSLRQPRAVPPADHSADAPDPSLARLPTPAEIAAEVRRRPIGAVIADICRDLGIVPNNPLWRELSRAIIEYGGNLATLYKDISKRVCEWILNPPPTPHPEEAPPPPLPSVPVPATGPP